MAKGKTRTRPRTIRTQDGTAIGRIGRSPEGWWWQRRSDGLNSGASLRSGRDAEAALRLAAGPG